MSNVSERFGKPGIILTMLLGLLGTPPHHVHAGLVGVIPHMQLLPSRFDLSLCCPVGIDRRFPCLPSRS